MNFKSGTVYYLKNCQAVYPTKDKFVVCISPMRLLFYFINSVDEKRPYAHEGDHVVFLETYQMQCLSHKSYINVSKIGEIQQNQFSDAHMKEPLSNEILLRLKSKIAANRKLSREQKNIVLEELHI
jgi:hypothetical protein